MERAARFAARLRGRQHVGTSAAGSGFRARARIGVAGRPLLLRAPRRHFHASRTTNAFPSLWSLAVRARRVFGEPESPGHGAFLAACRGNNLADVENRLRSPSQRPFPHEAAEGLIAACGAGAFHVAELLLAENWVDAGARDQTGDTALLAAARNGKADVIALLLDSRRVDPSAVDAQGRTALLLACASGSAPAVRALAASGRADPAARDRHGNTAFLAACEAGNVEVLEALMEAWPAADFGARNFAGRGAMELAQGETKVFLRGALTAMRVAQRALGMSEIDVPEERAAPAPGFGLAAPLISAAEVHPPLEVPTVVATRAGRPAATSRTVVAKKPARASPARTVPLRPGPTVAAVAKARGAPLAAKVPAFRRSATKAPEPSAALAPDVVNPFGDLVDALMTAQPAPQVAPAETATRQQHPPRPAVDVSAWANLLARDEVPSPAEAPDAAEQVVGRRKRKLFVRGAAEPRTQPRHADADDRLLMDLLGAGGLPDGEAPPPTRDPRGQEPPRERARILAGFPAAVASGDLPAIRAALALPDFDPNEPVVAARSKWVPIVLAARNGQAAAVRALLADPRTRAGEPSGNPSNRRHTALAFAIRNGDAALAGELLDRGDVDPAAVLSFRRVEGGVADLSAAAVALRWPSRGAGSAAVLRTVLSHPRVDLGAQDGGGNTVLHAGVSKNNLHLLPIILDAVTATAADLGVRNVAGLRAPDTWAAAATAAGTALAAVVGKEGAEVLERAGMGELLRGEESGWEVLRGALDGQPGEGGSELEVEAEIPLDELGLAEVEGEIEATLDGTEPSADGERVETPEQAFAAEEPIDEVFLEVAPERPRRKVKAAAPPPSDDLYSVLLDRTAEGEVPGRSINQDLAAAAFAGNAQEAAALLAEPGADPNKVVSFRQGAAKSAPPIRASAIAAAILGNSPAALEVLLASPLARPGEFTTCAVPKELSLRDITPLGIAIFTRRPAMVELLLSHPGVDPNVVQSLTWTSSAIRSTLVSLPRYDSIKESLAVLDLLLRHPRVDPNRKAPNGETAFHYSVPRILRYIPLILSRVEARGIDLGARDWQGRTILDMWSAAADRGKTTLEAAAGPYAAVLRRFPAPGKKADEVAAAVLDGAGGEESDVAVEEGAEEMLAEQPVPVESDESQLAAAAFAGDLPRVAALLGKPDGPDPNAVVQLPIPRRPGQSDVAVCSPLVAAIMGNRTDVLHLLLTDVRTKPGNMTTLRWRKIELDQITPLGIAIFLRRPAAVEALLGQPDVDPNAIQNPRHTTSALRGALLLRPEPAVTEVLELMLRHPRVDPNWRDAKGATAFHVGKALKHAPTILARVDERGIDLAATDDEGMTALDRWRAAAEWWGTTLEVEAGPYAHVLARFKGGRTDAEVAGGDVANEIAAANTDMTDDTTSGQRDDGVEELAVEAPAGESLEVELARETGGDDPASTAGAAGTSDLLGAEPGAMADEIGREDGSTEEREVAEPAFVNGELGLAPESSVDDLAAAADLGTPMEDAGHGAEPTTELKPELSEGTAEAADGNSASGTERDDGLEAAEGDRTVAGNAPSLSAPGDSALPEPEVPAYLLDVDPAFLPAVSEPPLPEEEELGRLAAFVDSVEPAEGKLDEAAAVTELSGIVEELADEDEAEPVSKV